MIAATAAVTLLASPAWAQQEKATRLGPVPQSHAIGKTLRVVDEKIAVTCTGPGRVLECSSESRLDVENTLPAPVKSILEVDGLAQRLEVNGVSVVLSPPEDPMGRIGEVEFPAAPQPSRLSVSIPGAFRLDASARGADIVPPVLVTRHPLLSQYPGKPFGAEFTLPSVGRFKRWKGVERTRVVLRYPAHWRWMPTADHPSEPPECPPTESDEPASSGSSECRRRLPDGIDEVVWTSPRDAGGQDSFVRTVALAPRAGPVFNGGPFVGAGWGGGAGCLDCKEALRLRAGYEIGVGSDVLLAIAGEFSPSDRWTVIPSFEYAVLPHVRWVPATALGIGVPIRLNPEAKIGGRAQASMAWPVASIASVGLVLAVDLFFSGPDVFFGGALQIGL